LIFLVVVVIGGLFAFRFFLANITGRFVRARWAALRTGRLRRER
jgi:hypothetical protein